MSYLLFKTLNSLKGEVKYQVKYSVLSPSTFPAPFLTTAHHISSYFCFIKSHIVSSMFYEDFEVRETKTIPF